MALTSGVDAEAQRKQTSGLWDGKVAALGWTFWRADGKLTEPKVKLRARKIRAKIVGCFSQIWNLWLERLGWEDDKQRPKRCGSDITGW